METSVQVKLGVAAECAELLGLGAADAVKLHLLAKCARVARIGTSSAAPLSVPFVLGAPRRFVQIEFLKTESNRRER